MRIYDQQLCRMADCFVLPTWVAHEFSVERVRSCCVPESLVLCDSPENVADYWKGHIESERGFNSDCEQLVVLLLDSRNRVRGHHVVGIGTVDSVSTHPREIFRVAIMIATSRIVLLHNHPSGDPTPSVSDIRTTKEIERAGRVVQINLLDHVIIGDSSFSSLRELGHICD